MMMVRRCKLDVLLGNLPFTVARSNTHNRDSVVDASG